MAFVRLPRRWIVHLRGLYLYLPLRGKNPFRRTTRGLLRSVRLRNPLGKEVLHQWQSAPLQPQSQADDVNAAPSAR